MNNKKKDWKNSSLLPMLTLVILVVIFGAGATFLGFEQNDSSQNVKTVEEDYQQRLNLAEEQRKETEENQSKKNSLDEKLDKLKKDATNTDYFEEDVSQ